MCRADVAVGAFVAGLGVFTVFAASLIPATPAYARVGPKALPVGLAALLICLGVGLIVEAQRTPASPQAAVSPNLRAAALVASGFLVNVSLIGALGFVPAAAAQYALTARAFDSARPVHDLALGAALALGAFLIFTKLLGVNIGAGILSRLM